MAERIEKYETVMIINTKLSDEEIAAVSQKFQTLISDNGTIETVEEWGKRRLAYPIEDETEGYYVFIEFASAPEFPAELARVYNITDGILRSLVVAKVQ
ncbi:MAG: 30S ribosomal protein S6 [Oscillospiraceae bacterium]|nr:30S ribosomal protein S6 [Oscillospiraceae bacterium]